MYLERGLQFRVEGVRRCERGDMGDYQEIAFTHLQALRQNSIVVDWEEGPGGMDEHHVLAEHGSQVYWTPGNLHWDSIDEHRDRRWNQKPISQSIHTGRQLVQNPLKKKSNSGILELYVSSCQLTTELTNGAEF